MNHTWQTLTSYVLDNGIHEAPRGRETIAVYNTVYSMDPNEHFDARPTRNLSLNYVFREFLWFMTGNRFDIRMANYAPIWKTCVRNGAINSNYGQYLFRGGYDSQFCKALRTLVEDPGSRRCWMSIFQSWHHDEETHDDYPCTTGMGFVIRDDTLIMNVHMRSQDLWWGAANDEPVCYLIQLLAQAFLKSRGISVECGEIVHSVDNLHLYKRHWNLAEEAAVDFAVRDDCDKVRWLCYSGFDVTDLDYLLQGIHAHPMSPLLDFITDIPGDYGRWAP